VAGSANIVQQRDASTSSLKVIARPFLLQPNGTNQVNFRLRDTATGCNAGGLWSLDVSAGAFLIRNNTDASCAFGTSITALTGNATTAALTVGISIASPAFISSSANPAAAGVVRLASTDAIRFRNNANGGDIIGLTKDASDIVQVGDTSGVITGGKLNVATGVIPGGSGVKHIRVAGCATAASAGAVCTTTVSWSGSFADANYTAVCMGDLITSGVPLNGGITAKATGSVTFQTVAATAAAAQYTTIDCVGVHD
jgi:hypothetical protein